MNDFFIPKKPTTDHWYKEPWMLLVFGGPALVVVAAIVTFYLAWHDADNVVSKNYYKQGLNINNDIIRDRKAAEYKMLAQVALDNATGKISLLLEGNTNLPASTVLTLTTRTNASEFEAEQRITLTQVKAGIYEGVIQNSSLQEMTNFKLWHVKIDAYDWRLTADWHDPLHSSIQLKP